MLSEGKVIGSLLESKEIDSDPHRYTTGIPLMTKGDSGVPGSIQMPKLFEEDIGISEKLHRKIVGK